ITENPNRKGMLFAGTGNGFFYSLDDGTHWTQFKEGLPAAPVTWIVVAKLEHDVVISTYGRGLFVLHDITRLEQSDKTADTTATHLFAPRAGVREARSGSAEFLYRLKTVPSTPPKLEVLDTAGTLIATLQASDRAGLNRATWDLRYPAPEVVALRTTPPDDAHIWEETRFKGRATRPITHWGIEQAVRAAPIAAPGKYVVRLTVDGTVYSQRFEVAKDPGIPSSDADLVASTRAQRRIVADMDSSVSMINRIEVMRRQIEDLVRSDSAQPDVARSLTTLDGKILDVELRLLSHEDFYSDDKYYVEPFKIYLNLIWLYGEVGGGAGDVQGGAEYRPTDASMEVLAGIEHDLAATRAAFATLMDKTIPAYNKQMAGKTPAISDKLPAVVPAGAGAGGGGGSGGG
ncbi:MAG TPA: hypothetical protein VMH39_10150, partial [Gemmatimonadaceae bacterium]|nr:hypothetical protein [Gemmatimonadaceae bacterium]